MRFGVFVTDSNLVTALFSLLIDPDVARRSWRRAIIFPGWISVAAIIGACFPSFTREVGSVLTDATDWRLDDTGTRYFMLGLYLWVSVSMLAAYLVYRLDRWGARRTAAVLLWFVGFGPLLCVITLTAYVKEAQGAEQVWDKTEKTGKVGVRA